MKQLNIFNEKELKALRYALGNINHDVSVIQQNASNPVAVKEYSEKIMGYVQNAINVVEDTKS